MKETLKMVLLATTTTIILLETHWWGSLVEATPSNGRGEGAAAASNVSSSRRRENEGGAASSLQLLSPRLGGGDIREVSSSSVRDRRRLEQADGEDLQVSREGQRRFLETILRRLDSLWGQHHHNER